MHYHYVEKCITGDFGSEGYLQNILSHSACIIVMLKNETLCITADVGSCQLAF